MLSCGPKRCAPFLRCFLANTAIRGTRWLPRSMATTGALHPSTSRLGDETLLDDSVRLADHARAAGADVKLDVFPEMQHVFQLSVGNMPEATDAVQCLGAWFKLKLHL